MENRDTYNLDNFIVNEKIDVEDLKKLVLLNNIELQVKDGWYKLILDLIKELNNNGWNKRVTCIKEKYGELRFYTEVNFRDIIEKYTEKSMLICEICGEKGKHRFENGYVNVECSKHNLENRNKVDLLDSGFIFNGKEYIWNNITKVYFTNNHNHKNYFLKVEFKIKPFLKYFGWASEYILIPTISIGFQNFIFKIPKKYSEIDIEVLKKFEEKTFCEICGYLSLYNNLCECCQNEKWSSFEINRQNKNEHVKYNQMEWIEEKEGIIEYLELKHKKNKEFKLNFSKTELEEYKKQ